MKKELLITSIILIMVANVSSATIGNTYSSQTENNNFDFSELSATITPTVKEGYINQMKFEASSDPATVDVEIVRLSDNQVIASKSVSMSANSRSSVSFSSSDYSSLMKKGEDYDYRVTDPGGSNNALRGIYSLSDPDTDAYKVSDSDYGAGAYPSHYNTNQFDWVSFYVTDANQKPQIDSKSVSPEPVLIGENVSYSDDSSDSDGSISDNELTVFKDGSQVYQNSVSSSSNNWSDVYKPTSNGDLNARFKVTDNEGATTIEWINKTLTDTKPNVTIVKPDNTVKDGSVAWNVSTENKDNKPNEDLELKIFKNGNLENNYSIVEGDQKSGSLKYNDGTGQTFKAEVVENDGDADSEQVTFDVDTTPPQISIDAPTGDLHSKKNIDLNFTVSDSNLDSSKCQYSKDGGANFSISNCENTTVTYNTIGSHNLTVYAEDTLNNTGSSLTSFNTDYENRIKLEDSVSSSTIQEFQVVFDNGTKTFGGSTTDGQFEAFTSELPTGSTELRLEADGYKIRNETLNIDKSFELRNTYSMDRASFTLDAKTEKDQNDINFNFTASNSTTSYTENNISKFQEDYQDFSSLGFPTGDVKIVVEDSKGERYRRTYYADVDENSVITLTAYLLEKGEGILTNVEIRDPQNEKLNNAQISIQRSINTNFKTVTQGRSTSDGSASFYLSPDISYNILVTHPQYKTFTGTFNPANYQYDALIIQLGEKNNFTESTTWGELEYKLEPDINTVNKTGVTSFNWTVSDPESGITEFGLRIKNSSGAVLNSTSITGTPSGGSTSIDFNASKYDFEEDDLVANGYFVKDQKEFNYDRTYNLLERVIPGIYSIKKVMASFEAGTSDKTQSFVALIFTLAIGTGLKSKFNRVGGGLITLVILGFFTFNGWFDGFLWTLTALALIGIYGRGRR